MHGWSFEETQQEWRIPFSNIWLDFRECVREAHLAEVPEQEPAQPLTIAFGGFTAGQRGQPDSLQLGVVIESIHHVLHRLVDGVPGIEALDSTVLSDLKGKVDQRYDHADAADELPDSAEILEAQRFLAPQYVGLQPQDTTLAVNVVLWGPDARMLPNSASPSFLWATS